ncbi:MAG: alpha/beta fold hydrolase [Stagnimonas sp.]|nr:alpha/beta fold hydrolase [Stagnimonas sp.]
MKTQDTRINIPTTDGLRLSALVEGKTKGPTLVFVHGYPDNLHVWDGVVALLEGRYRIIRYDVRGAGSSDAPPSTRGYRLTQLLADFRRVIDTLSPDAPVHLVGHDWGSIQAWEFATEPALKGRISHFTTISGPSLDHIGHALRAQGLSRRTPRELAASWYIGAFHLPLLGPAVWKLGLARQWPRVLARIEGLPSAARHSTQLRDGVNGINLYRANVLPRLLRPRARHAIAPVQLLVASKDAFVKAHLLAGLEQWAPGLQRESIAARHWLPLSNPQWMADKIADFNAASP